MRTIVRSLTAFLAVPLAALIVLAPRAHAQAPAAAVSLASFVGEWTLGLDTPQGSASMNLSLKDESGKIAGELSSDVMAAAEITDITVDGQSLVLKYAFDYEGQAIPARITLRPVADKWTATFDFADGQFVVDGTAVKK